MDLSQAGYFLQIWKSVLCLDMEVGAEYVVMQFLSFFQGFLVSCCVQHD